MAYSPRKTRLVKSYAPIVNPLTELLGIDKTENKPLYIQDRLTGQYFPADEFYVKKHLQYSDTRTLSQKSFRHISKEHWDQRVRNQRNGLGWKTDDEVLNPPSTIETFIKGE